jgi:hypothetical protein
MVGVRESRPDHWQLYGACCHLRDRLVVGPLLLWGVAAGLFIVVCSEANRKISMLYLGLTPEQRADAVPRVRAQRLLVVPNSVGFGLACGALAAGLPTPWPDILVSAAVLFLVFLLPLAPLPLLRRRVSAARARQDNPTQAFESRRSLSRTWPDSWTAAGASGVDSPRRRDSYPRIRWRGRTPREGCGCRHNRLIVAGATFRRECKNVVRDVEIHRGPTSRSARRCPFSWVAVLRP